MSKKKNFVIPKPCELSVREMINNLEEEERRCDEAGGCSHFKVIKCNEIIEKYICIDCGRKHYMKGGEIYEP